VIELADLPLFAGLDDAGHARVRAVAVEIDVPAGQTLVRPGDPGAGLFVLQSGTAVVETGGGHEIEVGPGEFVGELALLVPESTRSARVRAKTDIHCVAIGGEDFRHLLEDEPRIAVAMLPVVAERLWQARRH
jgi:CRP-like cAMP-binding protein